MSTWKPNKIILILRLERVVLVYNYNGLKPLFPTQSCKIMIFVNIK